MHTENTNQKIEMHDVGRNEIKISNAYLSI